MFSGQKNDTSEKRQRPKEVPSGPAQQLLGMCADEGEAPAWTGS